MTLRNKTIFFVHQNIPAQFRNLAPSLAEDGNRVYFITNGQGSSKGVFKVHYAIDVKDKSPEVAQFTYASMAAKAVVHLREKEKIRPDLIMGHVGWGEMMFMRDLCPDVPLVGFFEWFIRAETLRGFDPEHITHPNDVFVIRTKNVANYVSADICDRGVTPTYNQLASYPDSLQKKLDVIHDGIDTVGIRRPASASLTLPDGRVLTEADEVVTYVGRGLEPLRGFNVVMRAVAELCRMRPRAHVVIIGADEPAYGNPLPAGDSHRKRMLQEVEIDETRVHFLGRVPYPTFLQVLYVSSAHLYLTYPYILSWSMMEAMAAECLVIGSRTPPVQEVIVHGHNGLLVDFHDHHGFAETVAKALDKPRDYDPIRRQARQTILERYDLHGIALPRQKALIASLL